MSTKTVLNVHPKVFAAGLAGLGVAAASAVAANIEPSLFSALGVWEAPAFAFATTALAALTGWLKNAESEGEITAEPAPVAVAPTPEATATVETVPATITVQ